MVEVELGNRAMDTVVKKGVLLSAADTASDTTGRIH